MYTNPWLPSGFTYWGAGNWDDTGTTTSGTNDYITTVLPKSGKYYWETKLTALASAQVFPKGLTIYGRWDSVSINAEDTDGGIICYFGPK